MAKPKITQDIKRLCYITLDFEQETTWCWNLSTREEQHVSDCQVITMATNSLQLRAFFQPSFPGMESCIIHKLPSAPSWNVTSHTQVSWCQYSVVGRHLGISISVQRSPLSWLPAQWKWRSRLCWAGRMIRIATPAWTCSSPYSNCGSALRKNHKPHPFVID